jgi:murein DD-endopeptidase MepM/ murein hydrolase activator NlpD
MPAEGRDPWDPGPRRGIGVGVARSVAIAVGIGVAGWLAYSAFGRGLPYVGDVTGFGVDEPGPRPAFALPFGCGQRWRLSTYSGHNPDDMKLDMFRVDGATRGSVVRASAAGRVRQLARPGGVKIDHGGRWYTLYLHMDGISVQPGDEIGAGQPIGRVGSVGTHTAHLHYEQLFDEAGDGNARPPDIVRPVLQGEAYRLSPDGPFPVVRSTNNC